MRIRYSTLKDGTPVKKAVVYTQDEHGINFNDVDSEAVYITDQLKANGYDSYIVGGAVRDLILKKKPKDFDIVSAASPARIKKIFRNARIIGRRFRLVHVHFGPKIYEVSTFRSLKNGPTSNTFGTIEEDVYRRDFTLNALFYDPQKQIVVDYVGGIKDIKEKKIRPIIPLDTIFTDDPVRMIRAVKYGAATGFKLPLTLKWKLKKQSELLASISPSRLTEEILKIINSSAAADIVEALETFGLYRYLQPNASRLFHENADFRERYIKSFRELNGIVVSGENSLKKGGAESVESRTQPQGWVLAALIRDFLEDRIEWTGDSAENYRTAFMEARKFVLPMNPPRVEMDHAVRLIFGEHGITIKKSRFTERLRRPFHLGEEAETGGLEEDPPQPALTVQTSKAQLAPLAEKKRKRSRRRKKSADPQQAGVQDAAPKPLLPDAKENRKPVEL
ncbi:MAG: polynucleotide adenylyltransferase PcnB [Treponema sp.]|nr:polynucleotide adenylyltransferase PcnB [Treponema sp.]